MAPLQCLASTTEEIQGPLEQNQFACLRFRDDIQVHRLTDTEDDFFSADCPPQRSESLARTNRIRRILFFSLFAFVDPPLPFFRFKEQGGWQGSAESSVPTVGANKSSFLSRTEPIPRRPWNFLCRNLFPRTFSPN